MSTLYDPYAYLETPVNTDQSLNTNSILPEEVKDFTPNKANLNNQQLPPEKSVFADPRVVALGLQNKLTSLEKQNLSSDEWNAIYNPSRFVYEHGEEAYSQLQQQTNQFIVPYVYDDRSILTQGKDIALGVAQGLGESITGTAALGATLVGANSLASGIVNVTNKAKEITSDWFGSDYINKASKARAALQPAREILSNRNYQKNLDQGNSPLIAHFKQIGNDIANWGIHTLQDENAFEALTANAIGTLIPAVGLSSKLTKLGNFLQNSAKSGALTRKIGARLATPEGAGFWNQVIGTPGITNAILESGGSFASAVSNIENMSKEELLAIPDFQVDVNKYINLGLSPDEAFKQAKIDLENVVGRIAVSGTIPIAMTAGAIARDVIRNPLAPFRKGTFKGNIITQLAKGTGKAGFEESAEEGTQGFQQYGENLGKNIVGIDTPMHEGVGQNIAEGAIAGFASGASGPITGGVGRGIKNIVHDVNEKRKDQKVTNADEASQLGMERVTKEAQAKLDQINSDPDYQDVRSILLPTKPVLPENATEEQTKEYSSEYATWKENYDKIAQEEGLLSVDEYDAYQNLSKEEKAKKFEEESEYGNKLRKTIKYNLLQQYKNALTNEITGNNELYTANAFEQSEPFTQILQATASRDKLTDETHKALSTKKPFFQQIHDLMKLVESTDSQKALDILLDVYSLARFFRTAATENAKEYNESITKLLEESVPEVAKLLDNADISREEKLKQRDNLSKYDKQIFDFITNYAAPSQALKAQQGFLFEPFANILNIIDRVPSLVEKSKGIQSWLKDTRSKPNLDELTDAERSIYHVANSYSLLMDDSESLDQIKINLDQINEQLKRQDLFSKDGSIKSIIVNSYKIAQKLLEDKYTFLNQHQGTDVEKIHKALMEETDTVTNKTGLGVAITEHAVRLNRAIHELAAARNIFEHSPKEENDKQALQAAEKAFIETYQDLYNFGWNQRNKLYALYASQAMYMHEPGSTEHTDPEKKRQVAYNSFGKTKNSSFWSEQGNPSYKKYAFYNRGHEGSILLKDVVEYEIKSINDLLNHYQQLVENQELISKDLINNFERLSKDIKLDQRVVGSNFTNINASQATSLYQEFSRKAKEQASPFIKANSTATRKSIDPATVSSFIGAINPDIDKGTLDSSKFSFDKRDNIIKYDDQNILKKTGNKWQSIATGANDNYQSQTFETPEALDVIDTFIQAIKAQNSNTSPQRKVLRNQIASKVRSDTSPKKLYKKLAEEFTGEENPDAGQLSTGVTSDNKKTISYQGHVVLTKEADGRWVSNQTISVKQKNKKTVKKKITYINETHINAIDRMYREIKTFEEEGGNKLSFVNDTIAKIYDLSNKLSDTIEYKGSLDYYRDKYNLDGFVEAIHNLTDATKLTDDLVKPFASFFAMLNEMEEDNSSIVKDEKFAKYKKELEDLFKENGYEFLKLSDNALTQQNKPEINETVENNDLEPKQQVITDVLAVPIKNIEENNVIFNGIVNIEENPYTNPTISLKSLKKINLKDIKSLILDYTQKKGQYVTQNLLNNLTEDIRKKYDLPVLKRAGFVFDSNDKLIAATLDALVALSDQIDAEIEAIASKDFNKISTRIIKTQLGQYLDRNQNKTITYKGKSQNLSTFLTKNATALINYIQDQIKQGNISDILLLNNRTYVEALILDFLDQENKTTENQGIGVFSFSNQLLTDTKNLLNIFTEDTDKIEEEINRFFQHKETFDDLTKEKNHPFLAYLREEWNKQNREGFDSRIEYYNTIKQLLTKYVNNYLTAKQKALPQKASQIFSLLMEEESTPQQVTFNSQLDSSNIEDVYVKAEVETYRTALSALFTDTPFSTSEKLVKLLNYTEDPIDFLNKFYTTIVAQSSEDSEQRKNLFNTLSLFNKHAGSLIQIFNKASHVYDQTTQVPLNEAMKLLFFGPESLTTRIYNKLNNAYISAYNKAKGTTSLQGYFYSSSALVTLMKKLNIDDGIGKADFNRLPWLIIDKEGNPQLNKSFIQKAIIGAIVALVKNPSNFQNLDKKKDDLEKQFLGIPEDPKNIMAKSTFSDFFFDAIRNEILKYTNLHFKSNLHVIERNQIIDSLVSDIFRALETEDLFTKHVFLISKDQGTEHYDTFTEVNYDPRQYRNYTEYATKIKNLYQAQLRANRDVSLLKYFEFTPNRLEFINSKKTNTGNLLKAINTIAFLDPALIDTLVFSESNIHITIGENAEEIPVDQYQLHTPYKSTKSQQANIKQRQKQKFYPNGLMISLAKGLANSEGDLINTYLGRQNYSETNQGVLTNVLASLEGQRLSTQTSVINMTNLLNRILIETDQQSILDTPIRFHYSIQRMGRMMMTGFNPQSDKMLRELFLPSAEAINLDDSQTYNIFLRAVCQSLGVKVQYIKSGEDYADIDITIPKEKYDDNQKALLNNGYQEEQSKLTEKLEEKLTIVDSSDPERKRNFLDQDAVKAYQELIASDDFEKIIEEDSKTGFDSSALLAKGHQKVLQDFIKVAREFFPSDCTWVGLHGITEYLRYQYYLKNNPEKLKSFHTQLYLEADGIASGASNSIFLFSTTSNYNTEAQTKGYVQISKYAQYKFLLKAGGGMNINGSFASLMEQTGQQSDDDIYGTNGKSEKTFLKNFITNETNQQFGINSKNLTQETRSYFIEKIAPKLTDVRRKLFSGITDLQEKENLDLLSEQGDLTSLSNFAYNLIALYSYLVPSVKINSLNDLEEKFSIGRNFFKSPLTKYQYGAGANSIAVGLVQGNNLYPGLVNSFERKLTNYNLASGEERKALGKEIQKIIYRMLIASAFSVSKDLNFETNESEYTLSYTNDSKNSKFVLNEGAYADLIKIFNRIQEEPNEQIDIDFSLDPRIFNSLVQNTKTIITDTMSEIITEEMYGHEFAQNKKILLGINSFISMVYSATYVDRTLQEVDKKRDQLLREKHSKDQDILKRGIWLTPREQEEIRQELGDFLPEYSQSLDIQNILTAYQDNNADMQEANLDANFENDKKMKLAEVRKRFPDNELLNQNLGVSVASILPYHGTENSKAMVNTYNGIMNLQVPLESGVMILPQLVQGMSEAAIMRIMTVMNAKGLDVYDGFNMMLYQVLQLAEERGLAERANQAVYEVWTKTNVYRYIGERFDRFYRAFYGLDSQGTEYSKLFHANLNTPIATDVTADKVEDENGRSYFNKFDVTKLSSLQQIFINNIAPLINSILGLQDSPELVRALKTIFPNQQNPEFLTKKEITQALLPLEADLPEQKQVKAQNIQKVMFLARNALLQAEQKIAIKQTIMDKLIDVTVDQMGGSARKYLHLADRKGYDFVDVNGNTHHLDRIINFKEYQQENPGATYEQYIENIYAPQYSNLFKQLRLSQNHSLITLAQNTILKDIYKHTNSENINDYFTRVLLQQSFSDSLENLILQNTIRAQEEKNYDYRKHIEKDVKVFTAQDLITLLRKKINSNSLHLSAEQKTVYRHLLSLFENHPDMLNDVNIVEPTARFMSYFLANITDEDLKKAFTDLLNEKGIKVGWFNVGKDELTKNVKRAYGIFEQTRPTNKVITLFSQNIDSTLERNEQYVLASLHELTHAFLANWTDNAFILNEATATFSINEKFVKGYQPIQRRTLEHILNMFNQYYNAKYNRNPQSIKTTVSAKTLWNEFHEFLARSATYDPMTQRIAITDPAYQVKSPNTLMGRLMDILRIAGEDLFELVCNLLHLPKNKTVSDVFYETHKALILLERTANYYHNNVFTITPTENVQSQPMNMDWENTVDDDNSINAFHATLEQNIRTAHIQSSYPQELSLINDDGTENQNINTSLNNIVSYLNFSLDQKERFTQTAKEIQTLMLAQPEQLTNIIETIQEFYKQLDSNLISSVIAENPTDVTTIDDITDILLNSLQNLTELSTSTIRHNIDIRNPEYTMAIPIIIALNEVSEPMQKITSKMNYSLLRDKHSSKDMNQKIRDIAHNLYITLQGRKNEQNINAQLLNIRNEVALENQPSLLDSLPSITPLFDTVDNGFNKLLNSALSYISNEEKHTFTQILPMVLRANTTPIQQTLDDLMLRIASHNPDSYFYSLLNEMLPSSNYKKAFYWLRNRGKAAIDQERQEYRTHMPEHIKAFFTKKYTKDQWKSLSRSIALTDLSCFSEDNRNLLFEGIQQQGKAYLTQEFEDKLNNVFSFIQSLNPEQQLTTKEDFAETYINELAEYLATNHISNPSNLYKNVYTIGISLFNSEDWINQFDTDDEYMRVAKELEELITLKALTLLSEEDLNTLTLTLNQDAEAIGKTLNMLSQFKQNEEGKIDSHSYDGINAKLNAWKGYLPTSIVSGTSIRLGRESELKELKANGYQVIKEADTTGTNLDSVAYLDEFGNKHYKKDKLFYLYSSMPRRSTFNEGTFNVVLPTFFGNNILTRHTVDNPRFLSLSSVMNERMKYLNTSNFHNNDSIAMIPIFSYNKDRGLVISSYDLFINDNKVMEKLEFQNYLPEMMGFWAGRQREEQVAMSYGMTCLNLCLKSYDPRKEKDYINILDYNKLTPVQLDAVIRIPYNLRRIGSKMFEDKYGKKGIWIRKDIVKDVIGQRSASVMDLYNGITNFKPEHVKLMKACLQKLLGDKAYTWAVGAEQAWQDLVSVARNFIVIKSVKVMTLNNFGNIYQLWLQGVPLTYILKEIPRLLKESETYAQYGFEYQKLVVERDSTTDPQEKRRAQAQLDLLDNKVRSLSIAPIFSEFSTINDLGMDAEDLELMQGKVASWITKQVNKLPKGMIIAGKHILMTRDTPQYQFLEKATQYGDFIAKAILFNYLTKVKHQDTKEARYRVLDEFVNYGQLAGRTRLYLENMGMLWFFNYKLRIMKTAMRFVAEHPFRALCLAYIPDWSPGGPTGNVISDSLLGKLFTGNIFATMGPAMLFRGLMMHPILELLF